MHDKSVIKPLLWVPRYWPAIGGAELHNRKLAQLLRQHGKVGVLTHCNAMQVTLPLGAAQQSAATFDDESVTTYRTGWHGMVRWSMQWLGQRYPHVRWLRPVYAWLFRHSLAAQTRRISEPYNLIHYVYNGLTESAELAAVTAMQRNIPFVLTPLVNTNSEHCGAWTSPRFRRLYQKANAIIALTAHEREWLIRQGVNRERVFVCPYGPLVDLQNGLPDFRQRHNTGQAPVILFLGRVTLAKGCDLLLDAARTVWRRHPEARFIFLGPQDAESRRLMIAHADPRFLCIESPTEEEKNAALQACNLLCVPSRHENLGVVYLEAWCYRKPVIALDLAPLREVITHEKDGLLLPHDASSIACAINKLLAQPRLAAQMGRCGYDKATTRYNWPQITQTMRAIYHFARTHHAGLTPESAD